MRHRLTDGGMARCIAHKFGGSSMADAQRIRAVAAILRARDDAPQIVVVSAMSGVTDALIALAASAAGRGDWREKVEVLKQRHAEVAEALGAGKDDRAWLDAQFADLHDVAHGLSLVGAAAESTLHFIQGLGEIWSSRLLTSHLRGEGAAAEWLDAREVLVVRHGELGAAVDWNESARKLEAWRAGRSIGRVIVSGYVARDAEGNVTTLGRNGSDYSGAIFGALFKAAEIQIWTDVDGVLSADPRVAPEAVIVPQLSYEEACELAYFGAKVIHPQTMQPAIARGIPIRIRNTFNPQHEGSLVGAERTNEPPVKGIATISGLAIVDIEGAGMIGVPGTAERVFAALHRASISVIMISQGSSEHSICCVVRAGDAARAVDVLRDAFGRELHREQIQSVEQDPEIAVLAIVGDGMAGTPGIAARLFEALARSNVNVRAIAQGASERNISVAILEKDAARALRAVHAGFYLSPQTISIGVIGPGNVGRALIAQIERGRERLLRDSRIDLRVRAIASSKRMLVSERALDLAIWPEALAEKGAALDFATFAEHVGASHLPHALIFDCSASSDVADHYAAWLKAGIHVITPNKQAGAGPLERYRAIRTASGEGARFRYEATVGAGLPIISTLRDLLDTGDEVFAVEGILSGTLAWLFNKYDGSRPFSALVREAHELGYTEPDPRDDLSGMDVARKLVILAREMGQDLTLDAVNVEGLVPEGLRGVDRAAFFDQLDKLDAPMAARFEKAKREGRVLRYVAKLDREKGASVGLAELPGDHGFAHIRLTDNVVQFTTARYRDNPLVVQGPGAGPEVTAAGVFSDLLRIAAALGARV
jgi:bifunctional aspartokinase / homoserine dehydrogenase 1